MTRWASSRLAIGLWVIAVAGALAVLVSPLTTQVVPLALAGLTVCMAATAGLTVWFVRH